MNAQTLLAVSGLIALVGLASCGQQAEEQGSAADEGDAPQTASSQSESSESLATNRPAPTPDAGASDRRVVVGDFVGEVIAGAGRFDDRVVIRQGGEVVWERSGGAFRFDSRGDATGDLTRYGLGEDATGDGEPNLIISEFSGGAGCCWTFHIVTLGDPVVPVASIAAQYGGMFEDLDGDGMPEFVARDWTFASWRVGFEQSPAPQVVLSYDGTGYVVAKELMARPAPDQQELERRIEAVLVSDGWNGSNPPPAYWGEALELMYQGHEELGWEFMLWAWPDGLEGRDEFIATFREQLDQSPYAPTLLSGM